MSRLTGVAVRRESSGRQVPGRARRRGEVDEAFEGGVAAAGRRRSFAGGEGAAANSGRGWRGRSAVRKTLGKIREERKIEAKEVGQEGRHEVAGVHRYLKNTTAEGLSSTRDYDSLVAS